MRKFLAAAVPALLLMAAAAPGHAQTSGSAKSNAVANGTMDTGARDVQASRDLIGKRVVHRHGGPVAGTIQNVTTGADGQTMVELKLAKSGQSVMLPPASFERRGKQVVVIRRRRGSETIRQGGPRLGRSSGLAATTEDSQQDQHDHRTGCSGPGPGLHVPRLLHHASGSGRGHGRRCRLGRSG